MLLQGATMAASHLLNNHDSCCCRQLLRQPRRAADIAVRRAAGKLMCNGKGEWERNAVGVVRWAGKRVARRPLRGTPQQKHLPNSPEVTCFLLPPDTLLTGVHQRPQHEGLRVMKGGLTASPTHSPPRTGAHQRPQRLGGGGGGAKGVSQLLSGSGYHRRRWARSTFCLQCPEQYHV